MFPQGRARKHQMTSELGWGGRKDVCTECGNRSLRRLLSAQGRLRGVYLHSLLKPHKTNNHHKNNLIKNRVGEKIATYRRKQQGFRRGETSDYLHSREQTGGVLLSREERSCLGGEISAKNLGKTWAWEALDTSDGQYRLG